MTHAVVDRLKERSGVRLSARLKERKEDSFSLALIYLSILISIHLSIYSADSGWLEGGGGGGLLLLIHCKMFEKVEFFF